MKRLEEKEVSEKLRALKDWNLDGDTIVKRSTFPDFGKAIRFVNMVADISEELNHHPTSVINYNLVTLSLTTHSRGGLTDLDFREATLIDSLLSK